MKSFIKLYLKDYLVKGLSIIGFVLLKALELFLGVVSLGYVFLRIPLTICFGLLTFISLYDKVGLFSVLAYALITICVFCYKYAEDRIFTFLTDTDQKLFVKIIRPVRLKSSKKRNVKLGIY